MFFVALIVLATSSGCSSSGNRPAAAPSTVEPTVATSPPAPTSTSSTEAPSTATTALTPTGCRTLTASAALEGTWADANGTPGAETVPGSVYYGACGTTSYAVARFEPGPTTSDPASFQDEGAAPHYFIEQGSGPWSLASDGANFPDHMRDCSTFSQLPEQLRAMWQDCPNG